MTLRPVLGHIHFVNTPSTLHVVAEAFKGHLGHDVSYFDFKNEIQHGIVEDVVLAHSAVKLLIRPAGGGPLVEISLGQFRNCGCGFDCRGDRHQDN